MGVHNQRQRLAFRRALPTAAQAPHDPFFSTCLISLRAMVSLPTAAVPRRGRDGRAGQGAEGCPGRTSQEFMGKQSAYAFASYSAFHDRVARIAAVMHAEVP